MPNTKRTESSISEAKKKQTPKAVKSGDELLSGVCVMLVLTRLSFYAGDGAEASPSKFSR